METRSITAWGEVLLRLARCEDLNAYRDLRLDPLQRFPATFGTEYPQSAEIGLLRELWAAQAA